MEPLNLKFLKLDSWEELRISACWWSKEEPGNQKYLKPFEEFH